MDVQQCSTATANTVSGNEPVNVHSSASPLWMMTSDFFAHICRVSNHPYPIVNTLRDVSEYLTNNKGLISKVNKSEYNAAVRRNGKGIRREVTGQAERIVIDSASAKSNQVMNQLGVCWQVEASDFSLSVGAKENPANTIINFVNAIMTKIMENNVPLNEKITFITAGGDKLLVEYLIHDALQKAKFTHIQWVVINSILKQKENNAEITAFRRFIGAKNNFSFFNNEDEYLKSENNDKVTQWHFLLNIEPALEKKAPVYHMKSTSRVEELNLHYVRGVFAMQPDKANAIYLFYSNANKLNDNDCDAVINKWKQEGVISAKHPYTIIEVNKKGKYKLIHADGKNDGRMNKLITKALKNKFDVGGTPSDVIFKDPIKEAMVALNNISGVKAVEVFDRDLCIDNIMHYFKNTDKKFIYASM